MSEGQTAEVNKLDVDVVVVGGNHQVPANASAVVDVVVLSSLGSGHKVRYVLKEHDDPNVPEVPIVRHHGQHDPLKEFLQVIEVNHHTQVCVFTGVLSRRSTELNTPAFTLTPTTHQGQQIEQLVQEVKQVQVVHEACMDVMHGETETSHSHGEPRAPVAHKDTIKFTAGAL